MRVQVVKVVRLKSNKTDEGRGSSKCDNRSVVKWRFVQKFDKGRRAIGALDPQMVWSEFGHSSLNAQLRLGIFFLRIPKMHSKEGKVAYHRVFIAYLTLYSHKSDSKSTWRGM